MENGAMSQVNTNIINLVSDLQIVVLGVVIAAFVFCGICMAIPNDKAHDIAKKSLPYIAFGAIIALGAVTLGNWIYNRIVF